MDRFLAAYFGVVTLGVLVVVEGDRMLTPPAPPDVHEAIARQLAWDNHQLARQLAEEREVRVGLEARAAGADSLRRAATAAAPADVRPEDRIPGGLGLPER